MKKNTIFKLLAGYALYETVAWGCISLYLKKHKIKTVDGVGVYKMPKAIINTIFHSEVACATAFGPISIIFIDEDYYDIHSSHDEGMEMLNFIIYHELGHIKLGHIKANMKNLLSGRIPKRNLQFEIEADRYACDNAGVFSGMLFAVEERDILEPERYENLTNLYCTKGVR